MIDITRERLLTLVAAAKWWRERTGQKRDPTTLWRWWKHGSRAADGSMVHLEALEDGRRLLTSIEALQRFLEERGRHRPDRLGRPEPRTLPPGHAAAMDWLKAEGVLGGRPRKASGKKGKEK